MLLTLATTMPDASDLGYLLHKHPDRAQQFSVSSVGTAHVFWPEASAERAACSLLLEVDPVALVRGTGKQRNEAFSLSQYVNDRPYAAGSMLAVALGRVFHTAMSAICKSRQELADSAIPLEVDIPALSCRGDVELVERLFAPLGWTVEATTAPLDPTVPDWGVSRYLHVRLTGTVRLADALTQLYVLIPALDGTKHYYVGEAEVDVLLRAGAAWLPGHPERSAISSRYLGRRKPLVGTAIGRLAEPDDLQPEQLDNAVPEPPAGEAEKRPAPLSQLRRGAVVAALKAEGAPRVGDLGCGEGALLGAWAETTAATYGYAVRFLPVGEVDPEVGPPTQLAVFRRSA